MFRIINVSERTCKLTWSGNWSSINGTGTVYYLPEGATLYASPYLVVTPQGYTKHYYAEAERITSQLGKGQFADVGTPVVSDSLVQVKLQAVTGNVEYPSTLTIPGSGTFAYLDTLTNQQNATSTLYFYHPDHLGSSSWITTTNGTVKQHLHYLPWGEDFVNQRSSHFDGVRYTFSAKEKDSETGYSYFGARYYSSDLSIWLSVDPMAAKYPSLSPYVYCADNPVKLVDPNGEEVWIIGDPPKENLLQNFINWFVQFDESLEGNSDPANQGTITKQDIVVGTAVISSVVSLGATLEATAVVDITIATASTVNSIDDATTDNSGKTISQRMSANNPTANKRVNMTKQAISAGTTLHLSTQAVVAVKTAIKKGGEEIQKAVNKVVESAVNLYNTFKSFFKNASS